MKKPHAPVRAGAKPARVDATKILARDVMRTDVLVLGVDDPIRAAAEQFEEMRASGAPVVDPGGRLIGVLTLSDIARSEHVDAEGVATRLVARSVEDSEPTDEAEGIDEEVAPTEVLDESVQGRARVGDWMTPGVIQAPPDATLASVCRLMLDEDIHRVFIVDQHRLVGVVSTTDIVGLLAAPTGDHSGQRH